MKFHHAVFVEVGRSEVMLRFLVAPRVSVHVLQTLLVREHVVLALGQVVSAPVVARRTHVRIFRTDEHIHVLPCVAVLLARVHRLVALARVTGQAVLELRVILGRMAHLSTGAGRTASPARAGGSALASGTTRAGAGTCASS